MKYIPQDPHVKKYVDYYWIINREDNVFKNVNSIHAFPGVRPELTIFLNGSIRYTYCGRVKKTNNHLLSGHIHRDFVFRTQELNRIVVIVFQPYSLAALGPFLRMKPQELMKKSVCDAERVFDKNIHRLADHLRTLSDQEIGEELDFWLLQFIDTASTGGFVTELLGQVRNDQGLANGQDNSIRQLKEISNCSYSTIERYFKKETGLTPKKYQALVRYKKVLEELYDSGNADWFYYIEKYGFFDQSHFIKEIRKYTGLTPSQLLPTPSLRTYRPQ